VFSGRGTFALRAKAAMIPRAAGKEKRRRPAGVGLGQRLGLRRIGAKNPTRSTSIGGRDLCEPLDLGKRHGIAAARTRHLGLRRQGRAQDAAVLAAPASDQHQRATLRHRRFGAGCNLA
jgi:hypothetical protein